MASAMNRGGGDDAVDNGEAKLLVRHTAALVATQPLRVLDLFAGEGHMFEGAWRGVARQYLGVDRRFARGPDDARGECWRGDNEKLLERAMGRACWTLIDLDAYAPWPLLRRVLRLARAPELVVTATCGMDRAIQSGSSDFAAAVAGASDLSYLGIMTRWYDDVIRWALAWCQAGSRYTLRRARRIQGAHNYRMRYYLLEFGPPAPPAP